MKNMLRSTAAWLNEKVSSRLAPTPKLVPDLETPSSAEAQVEAPPAPVAEPEAFTAPILPLTPPAPVIAPEPTLPVDLPKLTIQVRGSNFYATCPHCESVWNLQQRLVDPRFKRLFHLNGLTCPKCDKGVAMPTPEDLRQKKLAPGLL